ncbi:class I SAM-dependent methyltransferase [Mucilaginibacter sp. X4EP1]|uniref:class I SAM-dependent methyltransferase n=1 Tax=Mucilaginibacter sp. X4EP1 TaxID=2723092 RepID=UPI00216704EC|nr:class I SAM-dependent methyltransferase [Mucilaginibacter sp. X4EP1]MCS3814443.1 ubiquinone/menaquinone biosynthesis C-methylase UbiE [Mucilaginibacter sp. X4EP1]
MEKDAFKFSGELALNYDRYLGPMMFEPYAADLVSRINTAGVKTVLEIACGTGCVTVPLRNHFAPNVELTATDFNADMMSVAESKLNNGSVVFGIEDAQNLSFPDNSFDLVICQFGLMFLQDKKKGLSEALRVLKPGGRFIFSTWDKTENIPLLKLIFNDIILPYFKDEDTTRFLIPFSLFDASQLKEWMEEAGFIEVETERVSLETGAPSYKEIVNGYFQKHALGGAVTAKNPADFDVVAAEMEKQVIAQFGETDIKLRFSANFVSGVKP